MELPIHTIDDAPADSRPVLEGIAADVGLVPNLAAAAAASPALLTGFDGLRRSAWRSTTTMGWRSTPRCSRASA